MMKLYLVENGEEIRCCGCGWRVSNLYLIADSEEEAKKLHEDEGMGLCAECICELIREKDYELFSGDMDELEEFASAMGKVVS